MNSGLRLQLLSGYWLVDKQRGIMDKAILNANSVTFIAPNGARVVVKDWRKSMQLFDTKQMMTVIFNDPLFKEV